MTDEATKSAPEQPIRERLDGIQCRLVGITGPAGSGKDFVADIVQTLTGAERASFADPIKTALSFMFGFPEGAWDDRKWKETPLPMLGRSPRELAQTLGTNWGRAMVNENIWIETVLQKWQRSSRALTVIPDVRFPNEAMAILQRGGVMIRVERDVPPVAAHESELPIPDGLIHQTITNDCEPGQLNLRVMKALQSHVSQVNEAYQTQKEAFHADAQ